MEKRKKSIDFRGWYGDWFGDMEITKRLQGDRTPFCGCCVSNHAPYVFSRHFTGPSVRDPRWLNELDKVIVQQGVDFVFPAHDDVVVALAQSAERIRAQIVSSRPETCLIARSKSQTCHVLADVVPVPTLYEDLGAIDQYPAFVRPDKSQGSQQTQCARAKASAKPLLPLFRFPHVGAFPCAGHLLGAYEQTPTEAYALSFRRYFPPLSGESCNR